MKILANFKGPRCLCKFEKTFYCSQCSKLCCSWCALDKHSDHYYIAPASKVSEALSSRDNIKEIYETSKKIKKWGKEKRKLEPYRINAIKKLVKAVDAERESFISKMNYHVSNGTGLNINCLRTFPGCGAQSSILDPRLTELLVGDTIYLTLAVKYRDGTIKKVGGDRVDATVYSFTGRLHNSAPAEVVDEDNGEYSISARLDQLGANYICVNLNGETVWGTPCVVNVLNHTKINGD
ncbi:hypothetical protein ACOME3_003056 [Neoechinorhynchus agilis]